MSNLARIMAAALTIVDGLAGAADAAQAAHRQPQGTVRACFVSCLAYGLMPRLLEALRTAAPSVGVELFEQPSAEQRLAVRERSDSVLTCLNHAALRRLSLSLAAVRSSDG